MAIKLEVGTRGARKEFEETYKVVEKFRRM